MKITPTNGETVNVEPIDTTSDGEPILDEDAAIALIEAWLNADVDEYRGWTTPENDAAPEPFIFGRVAPGQCGRVMFDEWDVLYDPVAGYWDRSSSVYDLSDFPFEVVIEAS